ncbi:MAG: putative head protein [Caudoviricetes sp.]|nr:MAG: putative head protein [Caudoviricetes sp.]
MAEQPQELVDIITRRAVLLERLKSGTVKLFAPFLRDLDKSLRLRLSTEDMTRIQAGRLETLLGDVRETSTELFTRYHNILVPELQAAAISETGFMGKALDTVIETARFEAVLPADVQVWAAITSRPLGVRSPGGAKLLESFLLDWQQSEVDLLESQIRQAAFEGTDTQTLIRQVRGTRESRYLDGTLAQIDRHNGAIVRTALQHVSAVARQQTMLENEIDKIRIVATLDSKTTQVCKSMDGKILPADKGPLPPYHPNCRTTYVPVLPDDYEWTQEGATRASIDGQVSADLTYYEWLQTQTPTFQDIALGPVRGKLFRDGGLSPDEFAELNLSKTFEPLTLAQMEDLAPEAFRRAGISLPD